MSYIPEAGDLIWLRFDPQAGHEQAGRRLALVLTPKTYNSAAGLAVVCPVTSKTKGYPFDVALPPDCSVQGVVQADQLRSLDWRARGAVYIYSAPAAVREEVASKVEALLLP